MWRSAAIYGCQGVELTPSETAFFRDVRPFGFILFQRNCEDPGQVRALSDALRQTIEDARAPILIDQEGGRVARLKPPHWRLRSPAARFGALFARDPDAGRDAAYLSARLIAHELRQIGVNVNCAPILDVPVAGAHDIIGDRAFSSDPTVVIALARAQIEGYLDGGVLPVVKHIPGHGRTLQDSHVVLPKVTASANDLSAQDFVTFRSLNDAPIAMTAHVVYEAIDPVRPATTSAKVIRSVIRGEIGFEGLLLSDDLSMSALSGPLGLRTRLALLAGCDVVLHCNGNLDEMKEIAAEARPLDGPSLKRANAALSLFRAASDIDILRAEARLSDMLGSAA